MNLFTKCCSTRARSVLACLVNVLLACAPGELLAADSTLTLIQAAEANRAPALPTLSEVAEHLHHPPHVIYARYIKFYPDKPSIHWEFIELHVQTNDYILRSHQLAGPNTSARWIPTSEPNIRARIGEVLWSFNNADRSVIYYDPLSLGFTVKDKNEALEAHRSAVLEINSVLNLGITYADRGGITVRAGEFQGANQVEGHTLSGSFLTSEAGEVQGADLLLRLIDPLYPKPREFHWRITYSGALGQENLSVYPDEMQYYFLKPDGTRRPLERLKRLQVRETEPLPPEAFRPDAILGTNVSHYYVVCDDGQLLYTNALGVVSYKASAGRLDGFFERRRWIRRLFPIVVLFLGGSAFLLYRKSAPPRPHTC